MKEFVLVMIGGIISLFVIASVIIFGITQVTKAQCNEINTTTGIKTEHHFWKGCYVEHDGKMIPESNWRVQ